jgi:hypothetical protein
MSAPVDLAEPDDEPSRFHDRETQEHIARLHAAIFNTYDLNDVVRYIENNTYLNGDRYSFKDHEFQKDIISDTTRDVYVQKCAQVGLSEIMARYVIGLCRIMPYFSAILTMPYSGDAVKFVKTRINPFITGSPDLRDAMDKDLDNTEIKGIGTSLFYARGTSGETAALSVPADLLVHDEVDRSDAFTLAQYQSRIKHSRWKLTRLFGTPTVDGVGIALHMASSLRHRHMVKCNCCNHYFVPSYHTDVVIPGYDGELRDITKDNLNRINWRDAHVICPACGRLPSLQDEHREWVIENQSDLLDAHGYYVTPFSVPNVVPTSQIVLESTKFTWNEFCNQTLGETNSDRAEELIKADVDACMYPGSLDSSSLHCIGGDMGNICHVIVGRLTNEGQLLVVHRERVPMVKFKERLRELKQRYRVLITVLDAFPHTDTIMGLQKSDKNLFGAVYHRSKKLATYAIVKAEEDESKGKLPITQAQVNRNVNFDEVMGLFKARKLVWAAGDEMDAALFEAHVLAMKRKQEIDMDGEVAYIWHKPIDGQDHYMHALGYLHVACRLMGMSARSLAGTGRPMMLTTMKIVTRAEPGMPSTIARN